MKHWQETSRLLQTLEQLSAAGREAALATVVRIRMSKHNDQAKQGQVNVLQTDRRTFSPQFALRKPHGDLLLS